MFGSQLWPTRRRRLAVAGLACAFLALVLGTWLALARTHPDTIGAAAPATVRNPPTTFPPAPSPTDALPVALEQVLTTGDPRAFAESVADALFRWDTADGFTVNDHTGRLLAVADPTGVESPGLAADLAGYLPTPQAWAFLTPYYTRQWLEISTVEIPDLWPQALAEAGPNLAPGTTAYTIRGTRHRSGVWDDQAVSSAHEVAFTMFIVCAPTYANCHLLRLSRLDEPLE